MLLGTRSNNLFPVKWSTGFHKVIFLCEIGRQNRCMLFYTMYKFLFSLIRWLVIIIKVSDEICTIVLILLWAYLRCVMLLRYGDLHWFGYQFCYKTFIWLGIKTRPDTIYVHHFLSFTFFNAIWKIFVKKTFIWKND